MGFDNAEGILKNIMYYLYIAKINGFTISLDETRVSDLYFKNGILYLEGHITPYAISDFLTMEYWDKLPDGNHCINIFFRNSDVLSLVNGGKYRAIILKRKKK